MNKKTLIILAISSLVLLTSFCGIKAFLDERNIESKVVFAGIRTFLNDLAADREYLASEQSSLDVLHYDINIELFPKEKRIEGNTTVTLLDSNKFGKHIFLNFHDNMKIDKILLNGKKADFDHDDYHLIIEKDTQLKDTLTLNIRYEGTPRSLGFSSFSFDKYMGESVVYTLNEPIYASTWFPCNDSPSDKAFADIKITNDSSMTSVSNGLLVNEIVKDDRKTAHWKTIYPISTYLIAIYSADYEYYTEDYISITGDTLPFQYYVFEEDLEDAKLDFADQREIMNFFENKFGPYPFVKEKYGIAQFLWQSGAMEHQTITGIGSNFITGRRMFTDILVHELAHHWWGNAVGPKSWKDIWLNEGFATYSEALYWENEAGQSALRSTMRSNFSRYYDKRLYDTDGSLFSGTIYNKGAWVLHMLRREVGEKNFFSILRNYYEKYKYKNASTYDFIELCEKISGKKLKQFFEQWVLKGTEVLQLQYDWKVEKKADGTYNVEVDIEQTQNDYEPYSFLLDIEFRDANASVIETIKIDKNENVKYFNLEIEPKEVNLDPNKWLFAEINR